jgi:hypothetical protein
MAQLWLDRAEHAERNTGQTAALNAPPPSSEDLPPQEHRSTGDAS